MTPQRDTPATLVDLLDRVLDKGLVIQADLIVSVAGIPLIGVNLRAALAGMETMLKYGVMQHWDERIRHRETEEREDGRSRMLQNEALLMKAKGSCYSSSGLHRTWRYGCFYLTSKRLILYHEIFKSTFLDVSLERIKALAIYEQNPGAGKERRCELHLLLKNTRAGYRLSSIQIADLKDRLLGALNEGGYRVQMLSKNVTETCPRCGCPGLMPQLLSDGCSQCGWVSPAKTSEIEAVI